MFACSFTGVRQLAISHIKVLASNFHSNFFSVTTIRPGSEVIWSIQLFLFGGTLKMAAGRPFLSHFQYSTSHRKLHVFEGFCWLAFRALVLLILLLVWFHVSVRVSYFDKSRAIHDFHFIQ